MGFFKNQFSSVVEWQEFNDTTIFYKWNSDEIKKDSRLVIRPGQDAIFLYNGRIEGIFTDEGNYEIASQIIPFLSTLKGFQFGFNSGLRAEVLFVNTRELSVKWGTRNSVNIPTPGLPGGLPIKAFGAFQMKVGDYVALIDEIAGVKDSYSVDDVRERVLSVLNQLLMHWIAAKGKDMFHLQANAAEIAAGIRDDLDMELTKIGLRVTGFQIESFSYPEDVQAKIDQSASYSMVGDLNTYQKIGMVDAMTKGGGSAAGDAFGAAAGIAMGMQMAGQMARETDRPPAPSAGTPCSKCGTSVPPGAKFCPGCGTPQAKASGFCPSCGKPVPGEAKFCPECGAPMA